MMTRRARRSLAALAVACGSVFALFATDACTIVNGLTVESDASGGDASDAGPPDVDTCKHAFETKQKAGAPSSDLDTEQIIIVTKDITLGIPPSGDDFEPISYDLDGFCTCYPHPESCISNIKENPKPACDFDGGGGQDNAGQALLSRAAIASSEFNFAAAANESVNKGGRAVLIYVDGYNGQPDDAKVEVGVLVSPGLLDAADKRMKPTFTASDQWSVDMQSAFDKDGKIIPLVLIRNAYVAGNTLVARLDDVTVPVGEVALLRLSDAIFEAKIVALPGGGHTITETRFAGRWAIKEAARVIGSFEASRDAGRICETAKKDLQTAALYEFVKGYLCDAADLRVAPREDGRGLACDAISLAVKSSAAPAKLGKLRVVPKDVTCEDATIDCTGDGG